MSFYTFTGITTLTFEKQQKNMESLRAVRWPLNDSLHILLSWKLGRKTLYVVSIALFTVRLSMPFFAQSYVCCPYGTSFSTSEYNGILVDPIFQALHSPFSALYPCIACHVVLFVDSSSIHVRCLHDFYIILCDSVLFFMALLVHMLVIFLYNIYLY